MLMSLVCAVPVNFQSVCFWFEHVVFVLPGENILLAQTSCLKLSVWVLVKSERSLLFANPEGSLPHVSDTHGCYCIIVVLFAEAW